MSIRFRVTVAIRGITAKFTGRRKPLLPTDNLDMFQCSDMLGRWCTPYIDSNNLLDKLQQIKLLANIEQRTIEQRLKSQKRNKLLTFSSFEPNWD